jgi:hypothetical protein
VTVTLKISMVTLYWTSWNSWSIAIRSAALCCGAEVLLAHRRLTSSLHSFLIWVIFVLAYSNIIAFRSVFGCCCV